MAKEKLKIRPECLSCMYLSGDTPESVVCSKGNVPTCYRKKKPCYDFLEKKAALNEAADAQGTDNTKPFESENASGLLTQPEKMSSDCVKTPVNKAESAIAYTDGSFNKKTNTWGYGVCMFAGDERIELTGSGEDIYGGWQVLGEISGALAACEKAVELGVKALEIRYDYEGIFHWAVNNWRANKPYTIEYAEKMRQYMKGIDITFTHVKAHTGVDGNENADVLAKKACGVYVPPTENGYLPSIPMGVNSKCRKCIKEFYRKKNPKFRDYINIKTYGIDSYSRIPYEELQNYAKGKGFLKMAEESFPDRKSFCSCVRWAMRGLRPEDAVKKVQVDAEVAENCVGSYYR